MSRIKFPIASTMNLPKCFFLKKNKVKNQSQKWYLKWSLYITWRFLTWIGKGWHCIDVCILHENDTSIADDIG